MQLYSQETELRCILTLVDSEVPDKIRNALVSKLDKDFFHFPPAKAAYERILSIAKLRAELIEYEDLVEDPALDEDFRDILKECDLDSCNSKRAVGKMVENLSDYRKLRSMYNTCSNVLKKLKEDSADSEALLDYMSNNIAKARRDIANDQKLVRVGKKSNAKDVVDAVVNRVKEALIRTGFKPYDDENGGIPEEGVMILSATTSGGKSTLAMQLCKNIYEIATKDSPKRVLRVSLEMGEEQEYRRLLSNLTKIPLWKFVHGKLSLPEKKRVRKAYDTFKQLGKVSGSQYDVLCPTRDMAIEEIFQLTSPYGHNIICIDYISLLAGVDQDNQWRVLSGITRLAKVYSREKHCLVILLCQLDDDTNKIRYSRGIKEHCDVMWSWNYSDPNKRETKILPISVEKARDAKLFTFDMSEKFEIMTVENINGSGVYDADSIEDEDEDDDTSSKKSKGDDYALS